jgi:hypothetical protein
MIESPLKPVVGVIVRSTNDNNDASMIDLVIIHRKQTLLCSNA